MDASQRAPTRTRLLLLEKCHLGSHGESSAAAPRKARHLDMGGMTGLRSPIPVMPGLVPGIHVFLRRRKQDVDGRAFASPKGYMARPIERSYGPAGGTSPAMTAEVVASRVLIRFTMSDSHAKTSAA